MTWLSHWIILSPWHPNVVKGNLFNYSLLDYFLNRFFITKIQPSPLNSNTNQRTDTKQNGERNDASNYPSCTSWVAVDRIDGVLIVSILLIVEVEAVTIVISLRIEKGEISSCE